MSTRRRSTVTRLRWGLLAFLVLMVGVLVGLFSFGRAGRDQGSPEPEVTANVEPWEEDVAVLGKGFEFTLQQEGRPIFHIEGEETRSDRDENVFLKEVTVRLPRADGVYEVEGERATYDQRRHEARIEGSVEVRDPTGLELRTEWLELRRRGTLLVASKGSEFSARNEIEGSAENLRIDLDINTIVLSGGVELRSAEGRDAPFSLTARRVVYDQQERRLLAEGRVIVDRGFEHLEAERVSMFLDQSGRDVRFLRALRRVRGRFQPTLEPGIEPQRLHFRGDSLAVLFTAETGKLQKVELEGRRREKGQLRTVGPDGGERRLNAVYLTGNFEDGELRWAEAIGPLTMVESISTPDGPLTIRTAVAQSGEARFDANGNLAGATLVGGVVIKDPEVRAFADRAFMDLTADRAALHGKPVRMKTLSGDLEAPQVTYSRGIGLVHATQGVRAELLEREGLGDMPILQGDEPVRVESQEAFLRRQPQSFLFRGEVRAWQGENLLLAEQMRGEEGRRMSASGGVKALWHPRPETGADEEVKVTEAEPARQPGEEGEEEGEGLIGSGRVEITSQHMTYSRGDGELLFNGTVEALHDGRRLRCNEMAIALDERSEAERMHCDGEAELLDPAFDRTVAGARAIYHLEPGEVEFFGDPLTVQDPERGRIQGRRLRYRLEDGRFWMGSAASQSGG